MILEFRKIIEVKKAQHLIEYCALIAVVVLALILMRNYVYRSVFAHLKMWEDAVEDSNQDIEETAAITSVTFLFYNRAFPGFTQNCGQGPGAWPYMWFVNVNILKYSPYPGDPCNGNPCTARANLPCLKQIGNDISSIAATCDRDTWNNTWGTPGLRECYGSGSIRCLSHVVWAEGAFTSPTDVFDASKNPGGYRQFLLRLTVGGNCYIY